MIFCNQKLLPKNLACMLWACCFGLYFGLYLGFTWALLGLVAMRLLIHRELRSQWLRLGIQNTISCKTDSKVGNKKITATFLSMDGSNLIVSLLSAITSYLAITYIGHRHMTVSN